MTEPPTRSIFRNSLVTIAVILAGLAFAAALLPRGFSDDLSRIGRGVGVAVLVHDKNSLQSQALMTLMNAVRADYAGKVEFLVADVDTPAGRAFVREQQESNSVLLFFGPDGTRRGGAQRINDEKDLRLAIDSAIGPQR